MKSHLCILTMFLVFWTALTVIPGRSIVQLRASPAFGYSDVFMPMDVPPAFSKTPLVALASPTPGYYETSEYMLGSVAVGVVFMESNGTTDTSTEDWTTLEEAQVMGEIQSALNWWSSQNPSASLVFKLAAVNYSVPTSYEPINRRGGSSAVSGEENLWISEAMDYLGYTGSDYFAQVRNFINALRSNAGTDWAFAMFIVDSSNDIDGRFSDGVYSAYAYFGGPFLVMTYDNDGWGINAMDQVAAHEIGHIFYATDEYNGVPEFSGYLNVLDVDGSGALMHSNNLWLSVGTWGQIGWRDSDSDGIQDIVDTVPNTVLTPYLPNPTNQSNPIYTGSVEEIPYPNNNPNNAHGQTSVTINTIKRVEYRVDGGTWQNATSIDGAFDQAEEGITFATSLSSGSHSVEARAVNSVGNTETSFASDALMVDLTLPSTSISYSSPSFLKGSMTYVTARTTFSLAAFDTVSGTSGSHYKVDAGLWTAYTGAFNLSGIPNGLRTIYYYSEDNAGNREIAKSFAVAVDNAGPVVSFTFAVSGSILGTSDIDVAWDGVDDVGIQYYEVKIDSASYVSKGTTTSHTFSDVSEGSHVVYVRALDHLGNSGEVLIEFVVDVSAPEVSLAQSLRNASELRTSSVSVAWTGSDEISGIDHYEVRLDENSWIDKGTDLTHTFAEVGDGSHQLYVKAVDKAGNYGLSRIDFVVNTSLILGPGWFDDAVVFGSAIAALIVALLLLLRKRKK